MWYCFLCLTENWYFEVGETYICGHLRVTSLLFYVCPPDPWLLFSSMVSAAECHLQLIRWPGFVLIRVSCHFVNDVKLLGWVCCKRLIRTLITVCSASFHLLLLEFDIPELQPQHPLEFEVSPHSNHFALYFLPAQVRMWKDIPYTVFDSGTLDGVMGAVNRWLLNWVVFSSVYRGAGACEVSKAIYQQLCFSLLGLCCRFS